MGYSRTQPTMYVVYWPALGVVKAGFSANQRWRAFVLRGAQVVDLMPCDHFSDAFALEELVDRALAAACDQKRPFSSADDAEPYLGNRGGGWLECWQLPPDVDPLTILRDTDWKAA